MGKVSTHRNQLQKYNSYIDNFYVKKQEYSSTTSLVIIIIINISIVLLLTLVGKYSNVIDMWLVKLVQWITL